MPDPLLVFIGDIHAGSSVAVMSPFRDHDGVGKTPSRVQSVLLKFWKATIEKVKQAAEGHDLILMLGGDLVDGVHHHGSTQTVGDRNDQRGLAVQLLLPYATMSKRIYALLGTDAHVGPSGEEDKSVAKELGAKSDYRWRLDMGGKLLDWAHHVPGPRLPWTKEGALIRLANKTIWECLERKERVPNLIVRHHQHYWVRTHVKGVDVFTVPGWQAQTSHTRKQDPAGLLSVGVVLWYPVTNDVKEVLSYFPGDPITVVKYAS